MGRERYMKFENSERERSRRASSARGLRTPGTAPGLRAISRRLGVDLTTIFVCMTLAALVTNASVPHAVGVGLLGATGPAGMALAARLASVGHEVTVGSRSKYRALEEWVERTSEGSSDDR